MIKQSESYLIAYSRIYSAYNKEYNKFLLRPYVQAEIWKLKKKTKSEINIKENIYNKIYQIRSGECQKVYKSFNILNFAPLTGILKPQSLSQLKKEERKITECSYTFNDLQDLYSNIGWVIHEISGTELFVLLL